MNDETPPGQRETLAADAAKRIERCCERFEIAWRAGACPKIDDFLHQVPAGERAALADELRAIEQELARTGAQDARAAGNPHRHAHDTEPSSEAVTADEARRRGGATVGPAKRDANTAGQASSDTGHESSVGGAGPGIQVRCPHCHRSIECPDDASFEEVGCPGCGSHFNLLADQTLADHRAELKTIGHFELIDQIGGGGFGAVWKARDTQLDRTVALKIPRKGRLDAAETEQFLREARAAAQLKHPNIVSVHEVGRDGDTVYIVSDYVRGATLDDWLTSGRPTPREAAELCASLADALHHAHQAGVIHRDLKPSNIMLDAEREPHVMDFGLAKREAAEITMTVDGRLMGTPAYMSPEQARGEAHQADRRSDVYSLGVIFFELLSGERPFRGSVRMLTLQIIHDDPPGPRKLDSRVPRDLETICLKCLDKDPRRRYQTAGALADDVRRWLRGDAIEARPLSRAERLWRWARRKPAIAAFSAVTLLLLVVVAGLSGGLYLNARARLEDAGRLRIAEQKAQQAEINSEVSRRLVAEQRKATARSQAEDIEAAHRAWADGDLQAAERLLARWPSDMRHWEWHYVNRLLHLELMTLGGTAGDVASIAIAPDGTRIVTAEGSLGGMGSSSALDVGHGAEDRKAAHPTPARTRLRVFDAATGDELLAFGAGGAPITCVALGPDGHRVATGCDDGTVALWDAAEGRLIREMNGHVGTVHDVAFDAEGSRLVTAGSDQTLRIWSSDTGREERRIEVRGGTVRSVAISPDGRRIASAGSEGAVRLWNLQTGDEEARLEVSSETVGSVAFDTAGERLAGGGVDGTVFVWDLSTRAEPKRFVGHNGAILSLAFDPAGERLASASSDGTVRVWTLAAEQAPLVLRGHRGPVRKVVFNAVGDRIVSAARFAKVWQCTREQGPRVLRGHTEPIWRVAISPDGKWAASAGKVVIVWNLATATKVHVLDGHEAIINGVDFSPDGARVVSGSFDGRIKVWDRETGAELLAIGPLGTPVRSAVFSPSGQWLASGCADGSVTLWDAATGKEIRNLAGHAQQVVTVAFSPSGDRLASCSADRTAKIWNVSTGELLLVLRGHTEGLREVAFDSDGKRVATTDTNGSVKIWDSQTGAEIASVTGDGNGVMGVAFSPDGTRVATGASDATIRLWDPETGQQMLVLGGYHEAPVQSLAFTPDGHRIVSASQDRTVRVWEAD